MITIALDAMGGDLAPDVTVAGALLAVADDPELEVALFGDGPELERRLAGRSHERIRVVPTTEVIGMADEPMAALRARPDASMTRAAEAVRDGQADGMVGAGNTGATMAAALFRMRRMEGVARPGIAVPIPVPGSHPQVLVDGGASVDCQPEWLVQFAKLGVAYARLRYGIDHPKCALLSNGEEASKGDALRKRAHELLVAEVPEFVGNVEGRDFMRPHVDVIVSDGFTGNIALKTIEGVTRKVAGMVLEMFAEPQFADVNDALTAALLDRARSLDPNVTGGALLVGVRGICVISHGSASAEGIASAIAVAAQAVRLNVIPALAEVVHAG